MGYLADEIIEASLRLGCQANIISLGESKQIITEIHPRFLSSKSFDCYPLYSFINNTVGIHDPKSWSWISNYLNTEPVIIFFEPTTDKSMIKIENGFNLSAILGECFGFVYYLTNLNYEYLVCETDSDTLIGTGKARKWIEQKLKEKKKIKDKSNSYSS